MSMADLPLPTTGALRGATHLLPVRVYYEDTDAGGIVYHASYLRFAERARTEMLRAVGIDPADVHNQGLAFVVYGADVTYRAPARLEDMVMVVSTLVELGHASATIAQTMRRIVDSTSLGEELATCRIRVACMRTAGGPGRMPADVRARLAKLLVQQPSQGK